MRLRWLERAVIDLEELHDYIALENPFAAGKEVSKIFDAIALLSVNYAIGRIG